MKTNYTDTELHASSISQLRPIAEAGAVPEGCVRYYAASADYAPSLNQWSEDTHYIDIRLPAPAKADPYTELKKAHAEVKIIQINCCTVEQPNWVDLPRPEYFGEPHEYRIKPETFEAHGKTWMRHTPGDAMPCDRNAMVSVMYQSDGQDVTQAMVLSACPAHERIWPDVIGWRYADEPTPEPLEPEPWTPKIGDVVTLKSGGPKMTVMQDMGHKFLCAYDFHGEVKTVSISTNCLQPA